MSSWLQRSESRKENASTTLHRSPTQRRALQERKKPDLKPTPENSEWGLAVLHPPLDKNNKNSQLASTDFDIVLVPGLGADPEKSWVGESKEGKADEKGFNWATDSLVKDFPRSRLLLFKYQSAWQGTFQVEQYMRNIAVQLLNGLNALRKENQKREDQKRPIVFIGHSMGGIVIAKAVHMMAHTMREKFPLMFAATSACIFFGAPFGGTPAAEAAALYANIAKHIGKAKPSYLLDYLKPDNEGLHELKDDFIQLVRGLTPAIELYCFWEEQDTHLAELIRPLVSIFSLTIPPKYAKLVDKESATLIGFGMMGLTCNHRDLVKFKSAEDLRWTAVRQIMIDIITTGYSNGKKRIKAANKSDAMLVCDVLSVLEGAQPEKKRRMLDRNVASSSWIPKEKLCHDWLAIAENDEEDSPDVQCLWVRGQQGRGKTGASLAMLSLVEEQIKKVGTGQEPILLAYFLCEDTEDYCTAEDLLKSLIKQLINQQQRLASLAQVFIESTKDRGKNDDTKDKNSKGQVQMTVENLWQILQNMLSKEPTVRRVYFVLNNLHVLPERSDSTKTLMRYINGDIENTNIRHQERASIRWFITSRDSHIMKASFETADVRSIDLQDDKYRNQVQFELQKHAKEKIKDLHEKKKYGRAIAYLASSMIGKRAQNVQWIDIACAQLEELSSTESDLHIRRMLETMPQDLETLLTNYWTRVFTSNPDDVDRIKEVLRSLVLTYEDPSKKELAILAGLNSKDDKESELSDLIQRCRPLLSIKGEGEGDVVCFLNVVVKTHLLKEAETLLGLPKDNIEWEHGVLALRAFAHVKQAFSELSEPNKDSDDDEDNEDDEDDEDDDDEEDDDDDDNDDNDDEEEKEMKLEREYESLSPIAEHYMVKHWLRHACKAGPDIAEELSTENDFWGDKSPLRRRWLIVYTHLTSDTVFDCGESTALHVAASYGNRDLVISFIRNGHGKEIKTRDELGRIPLHYAAWYGRRKIVEELLLQDGSIVNDGYKERNATPLAFAAYRGKVDIMEILLNKGAKTDAIDSKWGPVINAAIDSGNQQAVELLVEQGGVSLDRDIEGFDSPLTTAALLPDFTMFDFLVRKYADKLPKEEYSEALVASAEVGRVEVFEKLLKYEHQQTFFQDAIDAAAENYKWEVVDILLETFDNLSCERVLRQAAKDRIDDTKRIDAIWKYIKGEVSLDARNRCLYHASDMEKEETVKFILENFRVNVNASFDEEEYEYVNALTAAAYDNANDGKIVNLLLGAGADPNDRNGYALLVAASMGHSKIVELLIDKGADVNGITNNDNIECGTALQAACEAGQLEIVKLLLQHGADPNLGRGDDSPPIFAAASMDGKIVEELLRAKADVNMLGGGSSKSSALIQAAKCLPFETVKTLIENGADVNQADEDGNTSLICVAHNDDHESAAYLLDHGADILHVNNNNLNALQVAVAEESSDCAELLIEGVSVLLATLRKARAMGDMSVERYMQSMKKDFQATRYIEEKEAETEDEEADETNSASRDNEMADSRDNIPELEERNAPVGDKRSSPVREEIPGNTRPTYNQQSREQEKRSLSSYGGSSNNDLRRQSWDQTPEIIQPYQPPPTSVNQPSNGAMSPPRQRWVQQSAPSNTNSNSASGGSTAVLRSKPAPNIYQTPPPPARNSAFNPHSTTVVNGLYERAPENIPPMNQVPSTLSFPYYDQNQTNSRPTNQRQDDAVSYQPPPTYDRFQHSHSPQSSASNDIPNPSATPPRRLSPYQQTAGQPITPQQYRRPVATPEQNTQSYRDEHRGQSTQYAYQPAGAATYTQPYASQINQQRGWQNSYTQQQRGHREHGQPGRSPRYDGEDWG